MAVNAFSPCFLLLAFGIPAVMSGLIPLRPMVVPVPHVVPVPVAVGVPMGVGMGGFGGHGMMQKKMMMNHAMRKGFSMGQRSQKSYDRRSPSKFLPQNGNFAKPESVMFDPHNSYQGKFEGPIIQKSLWNNRDYMLNGVGPVKRARNVFNNIELEANFHGNYGPHDNYGPNIDFAQQANTQDRRGVEMRDQVIDMGPAPGPQVIYVNSNGYTDDRSWDSRDRRDRFDDRNGYGNVQIIDARPTPAPAAPAPTQQPQVIVVQGNGYDDRRGSNDNNLYNDISLKDDLSYTKIPHEAGRAVAIGYSDDSSKVHLITQADQAVNTMATNVADTALVNTAPQDSYLTAPQDTYVLDQNQLGGAGLFDLPAQGAQDTYVINESQLGGWTDTAAPAGTAAPATGGSYYSDFPAQSSYPMEQSAYPLDQAAAPASATGGSYYSDFPLDQQQPLL